MSHYERRTCGRREALRGRVVSLAAQRRRFGYRRIHALLRREGEHVNVNRVHHQVWSMDFVSDALEHGRRLKCLTIVDDCSKEAAAVEIYLIMLSPQLETG